MTLYNIHNPTMARRVIYDGTPAQNKITIEAGATKYAVRIEPHIAAGFSDGRDGRKDDLWLMLTDPPPPSQPTQGHAPAAPPPDHPAPQPIPEQGLPPPPPQMPAGYRRYQAPAIEDPVEKAIREEAAAENGDEGIKEETAQRSPPRKRKPAKKKAAKPAAAARHHP